MPMADGTTGRVASRWWSLARAFRAAGVIGASDKDGKGILDAPVQVPDFMASIYHKLGIDYTKEYMSNIERPLRIVPDGKPLAFL